MPDPDLLDENGHARYGEVVYTRPSPEEIDEAGRRIAIIRDNISILRSELEILERGWAPLPGDDRRFRDAQGCLTAALVLLADAERRFPRHAGAKRERLAHPESYVVKDGFHDERYEHGLVEVWWWDSYHQDFGPSMRPMPWREGASIMLTHRSDGETSFRRHLLEDHGFDSAGMTVAEAQKEHRRRHGDHVEC